MKYLLLSIVCSSLVFGYTINFNKTFSQEISNDEITSYISIYSKAKTQNKAINGLSRYKKFMDKSKDIEKTNIRQSSYPEYRYEKSSNKRHLEGYKATINYSIHSDDVKKITEYLEDILKIRRDEKKIQITFSNLTYRVSKRKKELAEEDLRLSAIIWANKYAKTLSAKTGNRCKVDDIVVGTNNYKRATSRVYTTLAAKGASMESADMSLPQPSDTNISLGATFKFECK